MVEKRRYTPGTRRSDLGKGDGELSASRWAWLKCNLGQLVILVYPGKSSPDVHLFHPIPRGRPTRFNLTGLTEEELDAFERLVQTAINWARPIVQERDKDAEEAFSRGDDSHSRVYRQVPQLVFRKGIKRAHWEELRERPEGSAGVEPTPGDPNAGLRGMGSEVSERDEGNSSEQDD